MRKAHKADKKKRLKTYSSNKTYSRMSIPKWCKRRDATRMCIEYERSNLFPITK